MPVRFRASAIFVRDIGVSRAFYEGLLGQHVTADHGTIVFFVGGLALWDEEHAGRTIFGGYRAAASAERPHRLEIYFESEEIDSTFRELQAAGVRIIHSVREEPWGQRTFRCLDPDGHVVEFGEPVEAAAARLSRQGWAPESISGRTGLPMEAVLQAIGHPRFC